MSAPTIKIAIAIGAAVVSMCYAYFRYRNNKREEEQYGNNGTEGPRISESGTAQCSVCLKYFSNFSGRLNLPCGHPLHQHCAELLFVQRENSCPWCRKRVNPEFLRAHFKEM